MKTIVIAAGYATRLYPLTENFPKPMLEIGKSTILDRLLDDIDTIPEVDGHIVVTNHKFAGIFRKWAEKRPNVTIRLERELRKWQDVDAVSIFEHRQVTVTRAVAYDVSDATALAKRRAHPHDIVIAPLDIERVETHEHIHDHVLP